jgi:hypothetical protein
VGVKARGHTRDSSGGVGGGVNSESVLLFGYNEKSTKDFRFTVFPKQKYFTAFRE